MTSHTAPLPMTVLSGFLGSGKTTLVNRLLRDAAGQRILILVNDFGDIAIDEDLIEAEDGEMLSLANGCACCSMGSDLFDAFDKALSFLPRPDYLLIEASGVAEPQKIANFAKAEPDLVLNSVVTLVDALNFETTLSDPHVGSVIKHQVEAADILLLSKTDLVSNAQTVHLKAELERLSPKGTIVELSPQGSVNSLVFGHKQSAGARVSSGCDQEGPHSHGDMFQSWSYGLKAEISLPVLKSLVHELPSDIMRFKGIFSDKDDGCTYEIHRVGNRTEARKMTSQGQENSDARFVAIGVKQAGFNARMKAIEKYLTEMPPLG